MRARQHDDFVWTFRFPIPNDDFANAQIDRRHFRFVQGNNRYASSKLDEPPHVRRRLGRNSAQLGLVSLDGTDLADGSRLI